jgi:hypothetical protein
MKYQKYSLQFKPVHKFPPKATFFKFNPYWKTTVNQLDIEKLV